MDYKPGDWKLDLLYSFILMHNKLPKLLWPKTTPIYYLTVCRSEVCVGLIEFSGQGLSKPKSRCWLAQSLCRLWERLHFQDPSGVAQIHFLWLQTEISTPLLAVSWSLLSTPSGCPHPSSWRYSANPSLLSDFPFCHQSEKTLLLKGLSDHIKPTSIISLSQGQLCHNIITGVISDSQVM